MLMSEKKIFETNVVEIGEEAREFKEIKMLILFGDQAPDALRPSCYLINVEPVQGKIEPDMFLKIDTNKYRITAVGQEVQSNLANLGHIAISFTGEKQAKLPGTLYVEKNEYPALAVNSKIMIEKE
ncbi:PTS glucitol/sorbitol transporter subunit IIA [Liquorilactobacillus satsumensis]|nr:PTS glucitol/sorbitol transporter subunit IIA [Liquorilactobacillus satsumensis]MCP9312934.1 PTS glucitol/sorbitol transporter subunit IIA [Liquorilactobacillus satsumensis]MCP9360032.1 PTS glucitol/sorbitol transporter subunit IIA [Liquorilactobacillus satsumensis]